MTCDYLYATLPGFGCLRDRESLIAFHRSQQEVRPTGQFYAFIWQLSSLADAFQDYHCCQARCDSKMPERLP